MLPLEDGYFECNECKLCMIINIPEQKRKIQDTLLDQTNHFQWIPGLGSFIEGYSLIVSKKHVLNTGCFDNNIINELELFIHRIKKRLYNIYKKESIIFEHGSMGNRDYAGGCIEHHHIHILPADITCIPTILSDNFVNHGPIESLQGLMEFNLDKTPYIYYSPTSKEHNVFEVDILPRQYMRKVIAAELNCFHDWDWRSSPHIENIKLFITKIKGSI